MKSESGFTLIELLVAMGIVGILASIAIPEYLTYRTQAFDARAISDMRNVMSGQEASYADDETYVDELDNLVGFDVESPAVTIILDADATSWRGKTFHPQGTSTYCYDSENEAIVEIEGIDEDCPE